MNKLKEVELYVIAQLKNHGLNEWKFKFDNAKRRYGLCNFRTKTISLSKNLVELNSLEESFDTVLHEVAHAIVGPGNGHNKKWRNTAISIGCSGSRCHYAETAQPKYTGECINCGRTINRHRRTVIACSKCCRKYNGGYYSSKYQYIWRTGK